MIGLLLHLVRLCPFLFGGHRQLALENLALRQQLAVYNLTAVRSPWQNPFVERLIGSIRRECLDHVVVLSESHLRRILVRYLAYYHRARTHLSLDKEAPDPRPIACPVFGRIVEILEVGGLHHRYERRAA